MHTARWALAVAEDRLIHGPMKLLGCVAAVAGALVVLGRVLGSEDE